MANCGESLDIRVDFKRARFYDAAIDELASYLQVILEEASHNVATRVIDIAPARNIDNAVPLQSLSSNSFNF